MSYLNSQDPEELTINEQIEAAPRKVLIVESEARHAMTLAIAAIVNTPMGEAIRFEEVIEQGKSEN